MTTAQLSSAINGAMDTALQSGALCSRFVSFATELNATFMSSPDSVKSAEAICTDRTMTLTATVITAPDAALTDEVKPISTLQHPKAPERIPTSSAGMGILGFVAIVGAVRLLASCYSLYAAKKEKKKGGHLYDILVILNNEEEAILENISHEDVIFFRASHKSDASTSSPSGWAMNASSEPLTRHSEVQFLDKRDLLGQSGLRDKEERLKPVSSTQKISCIWHTNSVKSGAQIGIIVKVRPARQTERPVRTKSEAGAGAGQRENEFVSDASDLDLDSCVSTPSRVKSVAVSSQQSSLRKASKTHVGSFSGYGGDDWGDGDDSSDGYTTAETSHANKGR